MSKTTKALAALGVVAGLGVAALPIGVGAAPVVDGDTASGDNSATADGNVSDTVTVRTEIKPTLTLEVTGKNDAVIGSGSERHLVLLGTNGELQNDGNGSGTVTVKVMTNHLGGYKVNMNGETTGFNGQTNANQKFTPIANNTVDFPTTGASVFGYKTTKDAASATNVALANDNWNGVKDAATLIATGANATTAAGDEFTITFQAHASESQAADIYDEVVTITATTSI